MDKINKTIKFIDKKIGPKNKIACQEDREMILECVLNSECFKVFLIRNLGILDIVCKKELIRIVRL